MGLRMLLLLFLHLGNVPWTEVLCVSLPAPSNVSISSFNMEHTLSFLPGPETPPSTRFTVEILRLRKTSWKRVTGCSELTAGQTCNLTRACKNPFESYQARVQAFTPNQRSNWTVSAHFQPLSDTVLGPPDVSVSGCGNCLLLQFRDPAMKVKDFYRKLALQVKRTRDGAQFGMTLDYKDELVITYLEPGVEYCVTISVTSLFNRNTVSSEPYCAFTSSPQAPSSLKVVFCLLAVFCALSFLLIGSVIYGSRLRFKLLMRRLPTTLSYFLLQGQNDGGAPPEHSGQISAKLHE